MGKRERRMTHDELLAKIGEKEPGTLTYSNGEIFHSTRRLVSWQLALRAVVELHKPSTEARNTHTKNPICNNCIEEYPCNTIQAIEKEITYHD